MLGGNWEALQDGRADLSIGATNEPPPISQLRWIELGAIEWVFAVSPRHPLAKEEEPLERDTLMAHRAVVVADTSHRAHSRGYGVLGGQSTLAVPTMRAKVQAQRAGLGIGWVPRQRVHGLIKRGELIVKRTADPREPNMLYVAWRGSQEGRALNWWIEQLKQGPLAKRLAQGFDWFN